MIQIATFTGDLHPTVIAGVLILLRESREEREKLKVYTFFILLLGIFLELPPPCRKITTGWSMGASGGIDSDRWRCSAMRWL